MAILFLTPAPLDAAAPARLIGAMDDAPPENPQVAKLDREAARRKLLGRAVVIGLLVLVAIYAFATFWGRR
ncbi:hypothetical protein [Phenylobacterium sp.]|uniref:hypothetical protein n=1 Tax=Phenylobacterium sp. TaxID=1871053 RepID=UPI0025E71447|nr:hypothetical protein [Phenylobacterium sp.]